MILQQIVAKYLPAADSDWTLTIAGRKRGPVVTLALEKPLFRNVPRKRHVVTLRGKKS
jgi:hypothetical protein